MNVSTLRIEHPLAQGVEIDAEAAWSFPEGLIGLPDFQRFALVDLEQAPPFRLLASLDDPSFGLVLVDPTVVVPDYTLALEPEELAGLGTEDPESLEIVVPVVLPAGEEPFSLNLKGPLLLHAGDRLGVQRVSRDESHAVRFTPGAG